MIDRGCRSANVFYLIILYGICHTSKTKLQDFIHTDLKGNNMAFSQYLSLNKDKTSIDTHEKSKKDRERDNTNFDL